VPGSIATGAAPKPKRTLGERILRAGFVVLAAHVCVRLAGYIMANRITNGYSLAVSDAYNVIWESVLNTAFLIGEQCLGPAYLPIFTSAREKDGEARAWHYTSILFNTQAIILIVVIGVLMVFPASVVRVLTKWDSRVVEVETAKVKYKAEVLSSTPDAFVLRTPVNGEYEHTVARAEILNADAIDKDLGGRRERFSYAERMLRWSALGLLGLSLASLTYMILNAYKEFFWAAFGDAAVKIGILAGALLGIHEGVEKGDWRYLACGVVLGGAVKLLTHLLALKWERLKHYRFSINLSDPYVRAFIALVLPLLAGILISRFRDNVVQYVLTSKENLPTYYKLGRMISGSVNSLIPYALSIALLPYFCDISARNDNKQLGEVLTRVIRMLVWFFVPLSIVLAAGALPITLALFAGENIHLLEAQFSTVVVQIFCIEMTFVAVEMMVMQAFFSSRRMIAPTIAGLVFSGLTAAAAYALGDIINDPFKILLGLSICLVLARVCKVIVLVALLKTTVPVFPLQENLGFIFRTLAAGLAAGAVAWGTALVLSPLVPRLVEKIQHKSGTDQALSKLAKVCHGGEALAIALAGAVIYLAISFALKMEEPRELWQWTLEKVRRRKAKVGAAE
jgi:peptidoglycan biosynthesis protein MviN/MurJ (putative lipid II flippase)